MDKIRLKIVNKSDNDVPAYATDNAAGMDLRAYLQDRIILKPLQRSLIPTGLYIELPEGYEAQIRPRSGLALKKGLTVLNTPGTIDSDYRGEIGIILINLGQEEVQIENGDRICQMVINKHESALVVEVEQLEESKRGMGGFGHTGKR